MIRFLGGLSILGGLMETGKTTYPESFKDETLKNMAELELIENEECSFKGLTKTIINKIKNIF